MTSLLLPLSSARSLIPPTILFGVTPHYFATGVAVRMLKPFLPQSIYEEIDNVMYNSYQSLVTFFFETFSGTKVIFYGDRIPTDIKENVLYICNHQSAIDWSLANFVAIRQGSLGRIRYIMKEILKYIPFFGPNFMQHGCIFVRRDGTNQDAQLRRRLRRFQDDRVNGYWLVIFPEGTRFSSQKAHLIKKSTKMAIASGEEPFENVLFPRTKAVQLSLEQLTDLDAVYDVTIAFKTPWLPVQAKQEGPSLFEFVSVFGREVHMHFNRIPFKEIPSKAEEQKKWLYSLFRKKDKLLDYFYDPASNGRFPGQAYSIPLKSSQTVPYALFYTSLIAATLATERGRRIYAKTWLYGLGSILFMPLLYRLVS
ncbi:1-acyl-sn-glycerol-3-phosphate acyltransferase epsilon-like [Hydractinia symbiolongicarpus]|uniref:1-acyl-sn-glycerol-3-phosphate acyltransferase epsilon-like n=1 Tax=Hydractinia symbiolongicarpus TaxID=13093 RepID=UPI00254D1620|nr:1-acyl-sn-glycerol-3-phosphate acyltransferase epsilon-like [Hydractinia symbiolongicarpus]